MRAQVDLSCRFSRHARMPLALCVGALLSACWSLPSADVRPQGKPRVIASAIEVGRVVDPATVVAVDPAAETLLLSVHGIPLPLCRIGRHVREGARLESGDRVRAVLEEVLTVYVAPAAARARLVAGLRGLSPDARVLVADPSYRVLTLQYPNGETTTFKVGLHTRMTGIEAGDSVAVRAAEVVELRVRRRSHRGESSRSSPGAASAR